VDQLVQLSVDDLTGSAMWKSQRNGLFLKYPACSSWPVMAPGLANQVTMEAPEPVKEFQDCIVTMIDSSDPDARKNRRWLLPV